MAALRKTTLFSGAVLTSALAILAASISPPAASAQDRAAQAAPRKVDFSYAFVPPHRLTIGRPDDSRRTLLDLQPGSLRLAWSYQDLTGFPVGALMIPTANWDIRVTPQPDGQAFGRSHWQRRRGYLPALVNTYEDTRGVVRLEAIGAEEAASSGSLSRTRTRRRIGSSCAATRTTGVRIGPGSTQRAGQATSSSPAGSSGRTGCFFWAWAPTG